MSNITIKEVASHRNGVGGTPFRAVTFTLEDHGHTHDLVAIISTDFDDPDGYANCYVIDPTDPINSKWRGDRLYFDLRQAGLVEFVNEAEAKQLEESVNRWKSFINR